MKNKSTLTFCTFIISCCFCIVISAQEQKAKNNLFDLDIVNYSDKPDADIEHYHLLQLTNNSNKSQEFELIAKSTKCKDDYNNIVKNQKGQVDYNNENLGKNTENNKSSSLSLEVFNKDLSKRLKRVSLNPKESINFYLKITRENNSEVGQLKCSKLIVKSLNNNKIKKSVIIKSFIPDSNKKGH